jgi:lysozyme
MNIIKRAVAVSAIGIASIAGYEGLSKTWYKDPVGIETVCYGHTGGIKFGIKHEYTDAECLELLEDDVKIASGFVLSYSKVPLSQAELDAYSSFVYNVGGGAFSKSTLLRKLNSGDRIGACKELLRWVFADGKKLKGLVLRRKSESRLCLSGLK